MKRRQKATSAGTSTGIVISNRVDRGQMILEDPDAYFAEARERAKAQARRDVERSRKLAKA